MKQIISGVAYGSDDIGKKRKQHWERVAHERGFRSLNAYILAIMDKDSEFNERQLRAARQIQR